MFDGGDSTSPAETPVDELPAKPFQILSLDGGGYKGIFAAALLASIEETHHVTIIDHFDLIVGTSTGGIIALGLAAGQGPTAIVDFYVQHGPRIFPQRVSRKIRWLVRTKYDQQPLKRALVDVLGDQRLIDARVPLVIPSYDLESNDVYLFKTRHAERLVYDWRIPMVDVALATAAAPTYFPAHFVESNPLIDGGLWANNPAMVGVVEAVSLFRVDLKNIRILSIGTTQPIKQRKSRLYGGGALAWARDAVDVALAGQSTGSTAMARHLLGESQVLRIDPPAPETAFALDRLSTPNLIGRARRVARFDSQKLAAFLGHVPVRPAMLNEPPSRTEPRPATPP